MRGMAAQIYDIAISAKSFLLDPVLLIVPIVLVLAILTRVVGRVALVVEDLRYSRVTSVEAGSSRPYRPERPRKVRGLEPGGPRASRSCSYGAAHAPTPRLSISSGSARSRRRPPPRLLVRSPSFQSRRSTTTPTASAPATTAKNRSVRHRRSPRKISSIVRRAQRNPLLVWIRLRCPVRRRRASCPDQRTQQRRRVVQPRSRRTHVKARALSMRLSPRPDRAHSSSLTLCSCPSGSRGALLRPRRGVRHLPVPGPTPRRRR